jgi:hypothetical protein
VNDVPEGAQISDDGNYWWDGEQWQPIAAQSQEPGQSGEEPVASGGIQINPEEYPSVARVIYFSNNVDGYLQDLGIDTTGLDTDDAPEPQPNV